MDDKVTIRRIEFVNFKAFERFSLDLTEMNILVGPNNAGKSTLINALRVLGGGLRRANARSAELLPGPDGPVLGHRIPPDSIPMSLENVQTNYDTDSTTTVAFQLSNGSELTLYFPAGASPILYSDHAARNPATFKRAYPIVVDAIPVLGPLEHQEELVKPETVQRNLSTHRAARHFRSFWYHYPERFDAFADLVRSTWPGMEIRRPEVLAGENRIAMWCEEDRITRDLYWAGSGFQVWSQLLTYLVRASEATVLVVDEPEIYLHPDLQRRFLALLRDVGADIVLATHSTEIVGEADPSEILLIEKTRGAARRLDGLVGVQPAMTLLGSNQNTTLAQLARTRRVLYVEGEDFRLLGGFARRMGLDDLAARSNLTVARLAGFSRWKEILVLATNIEQTLGQALAIGAVFDRDYRSDDEVGAIGEQLSEHLRFVHFHRRKEMENYLLVPAVLDRAIERRVRDARRPGSVPTPTIESSVVLLGRVTDPMRTDTLAQYLAARTRFHREQRSSLDESTIANQALRDFEPAWDNFDTRMELVGGKRVFAALNRLLSEECGVSLTSNLVIREFEAEEIPSDLHSLLRRLEAFRRAPQ